MDSTAWGILLGLVGIVPYIAFHIRKDEKPDPWSVVTLAGGLFSMPVAGLAIKAAIDNDPAQLPSKWREFVTIAAGLAIYLTVSKTWEAYRAAYTRPIAAPTPSLVSLPISIQAPAPSQASAFERIDQVCSAAPAVEAVAERAKTANTRD